MISELTIWLVMLAAVCVGGWFYVRFTFASLLDAARGRPRSMRFTIGDALCLVLLLQVVAMAPFVITTPAAGWAFFLPVSIAWIFVVAGWLRSVSWLSQAEMFDVWQRAMFQLVVLPATFVLFVAIAAALWYTVGMVMVAARLSDLTHTLGVFVVGLVATLGVRGLCGWIVKGDRVFFEGIGSSREEEGGTSDESGA